MVKTPLCRPGGKTKLLPKILKLIPEHQKYVEPFAGSAAVFFAKDKVKENVLNDKDIAITSILKYMKQGGKCPTTKMNKPKFDQLMAKKNKSPCEWLALIKSSFACSIKGFAKSKVPKGRINEYDFSKFKDIMKNVKVLNQDFENAVKNNDGKNTFFYVDPPYPSKSCVYPKKELCAITPEKVAKTLKNIKGKALISYSNHPDVRKAFKDWNIKRVSTKHIMCNNDNCGAQDRKELLISNY